MQSDFAGIKQRHPSELPAIPAQPRHRQRTAAPQKSRQPSSASSAQAHSRMSQACHALYCKTCRSSSMVMRAMLTEIHRQQKRCIFQTLKVNVPPKYLMCTSLISQAFITPLTQNHLWVRVQSKKPKVTHSTVQWILCLPSSILCLFIILLYFHSCQWADRHLLEVLLPDWLALVLEYFMVTFCSWKH